MSFLWPLEGRTEEEQTLPPPEPSFQLRWTLPNTFTPLLEEPDGGLYRVDSTLVPRTPLIAFPGKNYQRVITMDSSATWFTLSLEMDGRVIGIPQLISIADYTKAASSANQRALFKKAVTTSLVSDARDAQEGQSLELIGADIAGQRVSLRVRGNVNITGKLRNEDRSQQVNVNNQFQTNTFQIEQRQAFKIEGKIGDRISIQVDQDSERDFDFENNMEIYYTGTEDEIVQKIEAGNISLNLPGTKLAMFSGQNNGLFGLKALMKVGALDITTIASLEKGRKEKKSLSGDSEAQEVTIEDYDRRRNTYFYLNNFFRRKAYPLDPESGIPLQTGRSISRIQVYKQVSNTLLEDKDTYFAYVYESPNRDTAYTESGRFVQLVQNVDYQLNEILGYIRLKVPVQENEVLAVAYRDTVFTDVIPYDHLRPEEYALDFPGAIDFPAYQEGDEIALAIPNQADTLHLKLLKVRNSAPNQPAWDLEWKNVYSLRASEISEEGFELKLKYFIGGEPVEIADDGTNFLEIFGLDRKDTGGSLIPDGNIDVDNPAILDLYRGELIFPYLHPFMPDTVPDNYQEGLTDALGEPFYVGGNPNLNERETYQSTSFYVNRPNSNNYRDDTKLRLYVNYANRSSNFNLGFNVIEGSEEVTLNGVPLKKGLDYNIDYFTGTLTILNEQALAAGQALDIKYELHEFFNLDKKVILGSRAEYKFGQNDDSFIGLTALYFSKSSIDEKVRIGKEPIQNFIWDLNTRMSRELPWLTKGIDWLPVVKTDANSKVSFQGEIAQVIPNPNTANNDDLGDKGLAYLDDFEGSRREAKLNILRGGWRPASVPVDKSGTGNRDRAFTYWYNPYNRVLTKQIWPNKETSAQAQNDVTDILVLNVIPDSSFAVSLDDQQPEFAWGGIMRALSSGYYDQTEAKFLEMWVRQPGDAIGQLHIDLGAITEDLQEAGETWTVELDGREVRKGYQQMDMEDWTSAAFPSGDGFVTEEEDIGLDGLPYTTPNRPELGLHPGWDLWEFDPQVLPIEYTGVNGTEGNMLGEGGRYPDTEDLDGNQTLDLVNAYFSASVDLSSSDYIAGETEFLDGSKTGWKLIRVPLADFAPKGNESLAAWDQVKYARLWMDGLPAGETTLQIATVDIVGNEWQELGVFSTYTAEEVLVPDTLSGTLNVSVINTEDNPNRYDPDATVPGSYASPPAGVEGILDPITRLRSKEQSLVIRADNLAAGHSVAAEKRFLDQSGKDLIHYATMKLFVHGWDPGYSEYEMHFTEYEDGTDSDVEFFLRFGERDDIFYEVRQPVYAGWDPRNHVDVELGDLANFKLSLTDSVWITDVLEVTPEGDSTYVLDTLTWNELPTDKQYAVKVNPDGSKLAIRGNPSLSRVKILKAGFRNLSESAMTGEIWLDELRVTDVERETATAYRANMSLQLADLGSISMDVQRDDADFHNVQQQFGTGKNSVKTSISGNFNVNKFFPEHWGLSIPVSGSFRQSEDTPKYISGTDILVDNLDTSLRDTLNSIRANNESYNWNVSLSKRGQSDHWLPKYTIDAVQLKVDGSNSESSNSTTMKQTAEKVGGSFSYNAKLGKDFIVKPFGFLEFLPLVGENLADMDMAYLPTSIGFNANVAENKTYSLSRIANAKPSGKHTLGLTRKLNVDWTPLPGLTARYNANYTNNLDSLKNNKSQIVKNLDFGHLGNYTESYSFGWNPKFGDKFKPQLSYQSSFRADDKLDPSLPGLDLSVNARSSASFSMALTDLVGKVYTPSDKAKKDQAEAKPEPARGRGRGRTAAPPKEPETDQESEKDKEEEEQDDRSPLVKVADLTYAALDRIAPISFQVSRAQNTTNPRQVASVDSIFSDTLPGTIDTVIIRELSLQQVSTRYRLGLDQQPGFALHPSVTNPINRGEDWSLSLRSGIEFTKNLTSNMTFSLTQNQSERNLSQGIVESISSDFMPSGTFIGTPADETRSLGREGLPLPSFNVRYGGLDDLEWVKKMVNSASVDMDYSGRRSIRREGDRLTSEEYTMSINPRLSIQAKKQINGSLSLRLSRNVSNTFSTENSGSSNQTYSTDVNANVAYQHRGGLNIPLPFMEDKYLDNNIDFRMEFTFSSSKQFKGSFDELGVIFEEGRFDKTLALTPSIGYSFTDKVSGNIGYKFQIFEDKANGRRDVSDFSFGVNIQIKG